MVAKGGKAVTLDNVASSNAATPLQQQEPVANSTLSRTYVRLRPSRLAFASCNSQNLSQPLWPIIASRRPAAFVWGGDAIYADDFDGLDLSTFPPQPVHKAATPERLRRYYAQQLGHPEYRRLVASTVIFGPLDDHDFGANNGDRTYEHRRESNIAYVDFIGEPFDSPIRLRASLGKGVYGVKVFDFAREVGEELVPDKDAGIDPDLVGYGVESALTDPAYSNQSVAVFVIDVRSNRTPWGRGLNSWRPSMTGDFLGEEQWAWLGEALRRSRASVNVVVTGLQVHAQRFPSHNIAEEWVNFPRSRQRLYETLLSSGVRAPLIVSGDVHMAQLLRKDCFERLPEGIATQRPHPLMELTTSGLTHSWGTCFASSQKFHNSRYAPYYHILSRVSMTLSHLFCPWSELVVAAAETDDDGDTGQFESGGAEGAKTGKQYSLELNFGELEFDWDEETLKVRVIGVEGADEPLLSAQWSFNQLSGIKGMPGSKIRESDIATSEAELRSDDSWICVSQGGTVHPVHYFMATLASSALLFSFILLPYLAPFAWAYCHFKRKSARTSTSP